MDARVGRYQLVESIGEGAMGVVYRAHDPQLGRAVAIKVLREETDERAARLLREAQAMAQLSHPNLVTVFDAGRDANRVFLAMELVDGTSLRAWFESHGLTWRDRLRAVIDAGRGLVAAHEAGVVHRDFKPENVLVDEKGRIKVTDFGLARAELTGAPIDHNVPIHETATGSVFGTPAYMSPEQHAGTGADARSDQFAFAVTAWEAVWGQRPFVTESIAALVFAIRDGAIDPPPDVKGVPPRLQQILRRALSVDPSARYPSVATLLTELENVLGPTSGTTPSRSRAPIYALLALVLLLGGAFAAWQLTRSETTTVVPVDLKPEPDRPPPPDDVFRQVIEAHEKELVACYEAAKVKQDSGTVGIKFDIAADGHVRGFEITYDEFPGTPISRCVAAEVLKWDFPPGTPAGVNVGINLGRAGAPKR